MPHETERLEGTLTSWNDDRGFGFITPPGRPAVFVHISGLGPGADRPRVGDVLTYEEGAGADGRPRALEVRPPGAPPARRPRRSRTAFTVVALFAVLVGVMLVLRPFPLWGVVLYVGMSVVAFFLYAQDKRAAQAGRWRVPESTLLAVGLVGGWPGAVLAQQLIRHKTKKPSFRIRFWGTVALNVAVFIALVLFRERWLASIGL
ncbi:DUF1294 domain-containing protein [Frondihabitans australicus]|uniref:Uncharacterized membrane protein YsdA (DUF1294 family) n=1 Tax=Frondihabitans australicus TaxID=386892 RepID=A0A495IHZ3_9MICO|nr:DUF1294 domain-containing protein [Frondihabitans australicus]RKR75652.1 uncharacterized membrane protein YsdA (DUF1294 family) [Frondihabitans australicus]